MHAKLNQPASLNLNILNCTNANNSRCAKLEEIKVHLWCQLSCTTNLPVTTGHKKGFILSVSDKDDDTSKPLRGKAGCFDDQTMIFAGDCRMLSNIDASNISPCVIVIMRIFVDDAV